MAGVRGGGGGLLLAACLAAALGAAEGAAGAGTLPMAGRGRGGLRLRGGMDEEMAALIQASGPMRTRLGELRDVRDEGGDAEMTAEVTTEVTVTEVTEAAAAEVPDKEKTARSKKDIEREVAELLAGDLPDFVMEKGEFNHVVRILNTNVKGKRTVLYALCKIKGVGRRFCDVMLKRLGIDKTKRAGELTPEEIEKIVQLLSDPLNYDIPSWMLNRRKDYKTGKDLHLNTNELDLTFREDMDRLRKARVHRGLRHALGWKVRGQHTKTTGRGKGKVVARAKKPGKK